MTVESIGDEPQFFLDDEQVGFNSKGQEISPDSSAGLLVNDDSVWLAEINPGNSVTAKIVYDLPKDEKLTSIEVHDSAFSDGVAISL